MKSLDLVQARRVFGLSTIDLSKYHCVQNLRIELHIRDLPAFCYALGIVHSMTTALQISERLPIGSALNFLLRVFIGKLDNPYWACTQTEATKVARRMLVRSSQTQMNFSEIYEFIEIFSGVPAFCLPCDALSGVVDLTLL